MNDPNPYEPPREPAEPAEPAIDFGKLVCIAKYPLAMPAHLAKEALEAEGIRACVDGQTLNESLWHLGPTITGVKLLVMAEDVERAQALLKDIEETDFGEAFDDAEEDEDEEESAADSLAVISPREEATRRAWYAAVLGLFLCPPLLQIYSLCVLFRHGLLVSDSDAPADWRINAALVIDLATLGLMLWGLSILART